MIFTPRGFIQVLGAVLSLVALYLVLDKAGGASGIIRELASGGGNVLRILQGRG